MPVTIDQSTGVIEPVQTLTPMRTTVARIPAPADDMPTVTVRASFDWRFWVGVGIAAWIGYKAVQSAVRRLT